jgi:hypothetical protein
MAMTKAGLFGREASGDRGIADGPIGPVHRLISVEEARAGESAGVRKERREVGLRLCRRQHTCITRGLIKRDLRSRRIADR